MKPYSLLLCAALLAVGGPSWAQKSDSRPHPTLAALKTRLQNVLRKDQAQATITLQSHSAGPDTLIAQYQTQPFLVYDRAMTGQISVKPHTEVGPNYQGFQLLLLVQSGKYDGQAVIPQVLREPYWQTYIDAVPLKGGARYLWVRLSYGSRTKGKLLDDIKALVHAAP